MPPQHPQTAPEILIALCSYNGAPWLTGQLDSIAAQDHTDWALWISDDGSTDATRAIIAAFQARHPARQIRLVEGPRQGGAQNFLSLICHPELPLGPQTHLALCDQDDIWLPQKLSRATALLQAQHDNANRPLIYGGQSRHIDESGQVIGRSRRPRGEVTLQNAMVQNMVSGHSLVLNPSALALVRAAGRPAGIGFQDWWLSLLVLACGGRAVIDQTEVLLYRQHDGNVMGAPQGAHAARQRLRQMSDGRYRRWIAANLAGLVAVAGRLTPEAAQITQSLSQSKGGLARLRAFRQLGIRRQSGSGTALLYTACLLGWA